jgi:hypothetical protein
MIRSYWFTGAALAAVLTLGSVVSGDEPNPRPLNAQARPGQPLTLIPAGGNVFWAQIGNYGIAGYPSLQMEHVQRELGLTAEQKERLKEIAKKAADAAGKEPRLDWTKFNKMTADERQKFQKEMSDRNQKRAEEIKKEVEKVLAPKQIEQIKEIEFRQRAGSMLYMPQVLEDIKLSDEQKQQLQKIREETQSKIAKLQSESQKKTLGVLTPEQTKKLKELSEKGTSYWGATRVMTERPKEK